LRKPIKVSPKTERERVLRNLTPERRQRLKELIRKSGIKENK
jgi:hypothetical protein